MNLLEVENLSVQYEELAARPNRVVNGLSFRVPAGEVVGLVGESGSGKSTAALAMLGVTRGRGRITGGSVRFAGEDLLTMPLNKLEQIRGARIGLVTQNPRASMSPLMRVGEAIAMVYRSHKKNAEDREVQERAIELLRSLGINDPGRRVEAFPHELSGGMAQRALIAMALSCSPELLIADEPTSGLDVTVQAQVLDDLRASAQSVGSGLVLITRDLSIIANYCDSVCLIHAGEVVEQAGVQEFFEKPLHPSALALLAIQRRPRIDGFELQGLPVDGRMLPGGCYLVRRCPFADRSSGCNDVHPELRLGADGHYVRCHRAEIVGAAWAERQTAVQRRNNVS